MLSDGEPEPVAIRYPAHFEVFNSDYSVGVSCDRSGLVVGLHLGDEVWENTDEWLAREIIRVARLAHLKSRAGRRVELMATAVGARLADRLGLPTQAEYELLEKSEFGAEH
ncbi:hypothetical protein [Nocardia rhamnosiphila]